MTKACWVALTIVIILFVAILGTAAGGDDTPTDTPTGPVEYVLKDGKTVLVLESYRSKSYPKGDVVVYTFKTEKELNDAVSKFPSHLLGRRKVRGPVVVRPNPYEKCTTISEKPLLMRMDVMRPGRNQICQNLQNDPNWYWEEQGIVYDTYYYNSEPCTRPTSTYPSGQEYYYLRPDEP